MIELLWSSAVNTDKLDSKILNAILTKLRFESYRSSKLSLWIYEYMINLLQFSTKYWKPISKIFYELTKNHNVESEIGTLLELGILKLIAQKLDEMPTKETVYILMVVQNLWWHTLLISDLWRLLGTRLIDQLETIDLSSDLTFKAKNDMKLALLQILTKVILSPKLDIIDDIQIQKLMSQIYDLFEERMGKLQAFPFPTQLTFEKTILIN